MASFSNFKSTVIAAAQSVAGTTPGVSIYADRSSLPTSGNSQGDQAYVTGNNRLYIWNGSGWYNVALLNVAPAISSVTDSDGGTTPFALSNAGAVTTITITAADSDGDPITYSATSDSNFSGLGTLSQADNVFTITPFSKDSATTESGTITFTATDGVNVASSGIQTFTLYFLSPYWDEAVLSVGTSGTNALDNSTFIDRSTNNNTITISGSPTQSSFHPYHTNWSNGFGAGGRLTWTGVATPGTGDFTAELWVFFTDLSNDWRTICAQRATNGPSVNQWAMGVNTTGYLYWYSDSMIMQSSAGLITTGQWYHVAISRSGTNTYMFIDGQVVATGTNNYNLNYSTFTINANADQTEAGNCFLSNVRFTVGEALYTSNFTVPTENLTAGVNTEILTCASNQFKDLSGNNGNPTITGGATVFVFNPFGQPAEYAPGENKGSTYFGADNVHLEIDGTGLSLGAGDDFTLRFWTYITDASYENWWFDTLGGRILLYADVGGSELELYVSSSTIITGTGDNAVKANEWTHLQVTRASGTWYLFKNGNLIGSTTAAGTFSSNLDTIAIGENIGSGTNHIKGYVSDWQMILGTATHTSSFTPPTSPVGNTGASVYLPMDNAGIFDMTGNHTLTPTGNAAESTTQAKYNTTSIVFDGTGDNLVTPYDIVLNLADFDFTIEMWVYYINGSGMLINRGGGSNIAQASYEIYIDGTSGNARFAASISNTTYDIGGEDATGNMGVVTANAWNHIAVTRQGNTFRGFVNGVQGYTETNSGALYASTGRGLAIGSNYANTWGTTTPTSSINAFMEDVQILNGVAKYTANFTPPTRTQGLTYQAES